MHEPVVIETARLRLEPFGERHLTQAYVAWLNDAEVVRFSENRHRTHTLESCREFVRGFEGGPGSMWAILEKDGGRHVGNITAEVDAHNSLADVGLLIGARDKWGLGYGSEAFAAVVDHLLREQGMRKVTAGAAGANKGMIRVMERSGMVADGVRRRHYVVDGSEVDVVHMALWREGETPPA